MNYNIISYLIYLPISFYITIVVGNTFYKNGEIYLLTLIDDKPENIKAINKLLLIGYYLLNLGYIAITLSFWKQIDNWVMTIEQVSTKLGQIILILSIMHFNNLAIAYWYSNKLKKQKIQTLKPTSL
jgi:hypothetical protein